MYRLCSLQIVKEKDRFRKAPPNYAMKKTQLLKDKVKKGCHNQLHGDSDGLVAEPLSYSFGPCF